MTPSRLAPAKTKVLFSALPPAGTSTGVVSTKLVWNTLMAPEGVAEKRAVSGAPGSDSTAVAQYLSVMPTQPPVVLSTSLFDSFSLTTSSYFRDTRLLEPSTPSG